MKIRHAIPMFAAAMLAVAPLALQAQDTPAEAPAATGAAAAATMNEVQTVSYIMGTQMGDSLRQNKIEIDIDAYLKGLRAGLENTEQPFTPQEKAEIMRDFQNKVRERQQAEREQESVTNLEAAEKFLAENKGKEGIVTTESGLQYQVLAAGDGANPTDASRVKVHYRGTLLDGTEFDSSYGRGTPAEFGVGQVIAGWTEALKLMKPGAKYKLWIHPDMAYGKQGRPSIPPNSALVFEVELLEIH